MPRPLRPIADGLIYHVINRGRQRRWSAYVHQTPDEAELAAIRRSNEAGLPYGERPWIDRLCRRPCLDLAIRPRGRPRMQTSREK